MSAQAVEWVLVVYYGPSAHRATYGRLEGDTKYTKDYIQLSKQGAFLSAVAQIFSVDSSTVASVPLKYQWPLGSAPGAFVFNSADRPHLKWETSRGAPKAWKMTLSPTEATAESIPGDPSHLAFAAAENELALLASRGAGQPYLMAIKLRSEPRTLHLRAYLKDPTGAYAWADLSQVPTEVQALAKKTSQTSALAWSLFQSGGSAATKNVEIALSQIATSGGGVAAVDQLGEEAGRSLVSYLRNPGHGLFFDPARNHDAWSQSPSIPTEILGSIDDYLLALDMRFPPTPGGDAVAEGLETDAEEVEAFRDQIEHGSFAVADSIATVKARGSAQKAFAGIVKGNYGNRCAITGVSTKDFLIASHIVPWSVDQTIRLDPSNGICLSLLMDRAFEKGYLVIEDDLTIRVSLAKIGADEMLRQALAPYDGTKVRKPTTAVPKVDYLQRRRALVTQHN
jgi:hypothetical protein